jgi:diguanylate cyclase (GGDEF)-like protein
MSGDLLPELSLYVRFSRLHLMERKDKLVNLCALLLLPPGLGAMIWAAYRFPLERVDIGLGALSIIMVFFSSYLRIQLPRTKIHLTISDALIIVTLLLYGGEISVLLAALESGSTSINLRRQGVFIKPKTIALNVLISAFSVFVTWQVATYAFGRLENVSESKDLTLFVILLMTMALSQFVLNSVLVSVFASIKTGTTWLKAWYEYCFNTLVMYLTGALMAGLITKSLQQINIYLLAVVVGFFAVVYLTYRRYVNDVKQTAAKAEQLERDRAEQAEKHVAELEHYVAELEKSGTALRESREKFRHAAYHDALTQLPNRTFFIDEIKALLEKSRTTSAHKFAVLFLDLNRFKMMNDSLGHFMGDCLILQVAQRLSESVGAWGRVGRFSGDEFAIIISDVTSNEEVTTFAEKIAHRIAEPFTLEGRQVFTSVSMGIVFGSYQYDNAEDILRDADIAMYQAKDGQQPYVIFDRKMHVDAVKLLELETDLRYAIERDEIELYYQPIISLEDAKLTGFEALARWNHPHKGQIAPYEFIPVAESTGLIVPMTIKILRSACQQIAAWQQGVPGNETLTVSVNLSGKHFAHPELVDQIKGILGEAYLYPGSLRLEITESAVMENADRAIDMLKEIRALGIKLSIDDFGTGYSGLSYLHRFPIDTLKVDRSFVSSMEEGSENGEIVRTIIALAKALNLSVVAEGIESIHQLHQLRILGCEYGQGYLFARPLPIAEIEKMLNDPQRWQNIFPQADPNLLQMFPEPPQLRLAK